MKLRALFWRTLVQCYTLGGFLKNIERGRYRGVEKTLDRKMRRGVANLLGPLLGVSFPMRISEITILLLMMLMVRRMMILV